MAYLALIRHGQSEYNAQNRECGWVDSPLTKLGHQQAQEAAAKITNIPWDYIFESDLIRSKQTSEEIIKVLGYTPERIVSPAIKERDYGIYTGKNKSEVPFEIRRGWDPLVENGENLKQVYRRVVPYFEKKILPKLKIGKNVIISAHGNSLRALIKYLDDIPEKEISNLEIPVGEVLIRQF